MIYVQKIREQLDNELLMGEDYCGLLDGYTLLVLTKGRKCTNENVHDAWSIWQNNEDSRHRSLIPFNELTKAVQDLDIKYRDAIIKVAKANLDRRLLFSWFH